MAFPSLKFMSRLSFLVFVFLLLIFCQNLPPPVAVAPTGSVSSAAQLREAIGVVTTLAGSAGSPGSADGTGGVARFVDPAGITIDGTNLYVADTYNATIRKIVTSTGVVTTIAGIAGNSGTADGTGSAARFDRPWGITTDSANLYVADANNHTIREIR